MPTVIVDVDDTIADLCPVWVGEFLRRHPDCPDPRPLQSEADWNIASLVPAEFHPGLWDTLDEHALYDKITPLNDSRWGVHQLRSYGYRIVFATSATNGHAGVKLRWLVKHGFLDSVIRQKDYIECFDKGLLRGDLIIDDRPKTCRDFMYANGAETSLLYLRKPVLMEKYRSGLATADSWAVIPRLAREIVDRVLARRFPPVSDASYRNAADGLGFKL